MRAPEGFTLDKCCVASPLSEVYTARRDDGVEVVLKTYLGERAACARRIQREFELLRSLEPGVAPRPVALVREDEASILVLERHPGEAPRGPMPLARFLPFAVRAASALSRVHAARIVHQNVRPQSFLLDGATGEVRMLGFGRASPLGAPSEARDGSRAFAGPLLYMAPEQTGRLERGVDFRSDLYALGATFYELLSGMPPFDARDPVDLIHAHIAQRARPLVEVAAGVPGTLSRIVLKLLEKEPEDRYQTAEALQIDLDTCREQLERTGAVDDELPLGSADAPYRPLFRRRVYGRSNECDALQRAYHRAADGEVALVLVRGAPGIGKSALVPELHRPLALDGGYLARGKFDLYRGHLPYAGFAAALRCLLRQIACESEARRERWREDLKGTLGKLSGVVAEFVPEIEALLGEVEPVPTLEPRETQHRLALAVRRILLAAARHARPLVLFLDDLQWADAGSRYLLEDLLVCGEAAPLLVIGAYRDQAVPPDSPLPQLIERLERRGIAIESLALGPLSTEDASRMLADALDREPEQIRELTDLVAAHSGNNPLLIQQCVHYLHQVGCIRFVPRQGWSWDLSAFEAAAIPDDPVGMLVAKLLRLGAEARSVVQLASCVGDEFDVELLEELSRRERRPLDAALYELSDEGLIAPCEAGFRFVHDRIREAAQSLLHPTQRAQLHLRTAELLLERLSEAQQQSRCFEIADHLCRAAAQLPEGRRIETIVRQRTAGLAALQSGASASAAHYFAAGLELFRPTDWDDHTQLGFELHLRASDCAFQLRDYERARELLRPLEGRRIGDFSQALVAAQRIRIHGLSRSTQETLDLTLSELRRIGAPLPRRPSWLRTRWVLARTDWLLRGAPESWPLRPRGADLDWALPIIVRAAGAQALSLTTVRLLCLHSGDATRAFLRHGNLVSPASMLAAYAGSRAAFLRHSRGLQRYGEAAAHWARRWPDPTYGPRADFLIQAYANAWIAPRRECLEPMRKIAELMTEQGDLEYSMQTLAIRAHYLALSGSALPEVNAAFASLRDRGHVTLIEQPHKVGLPYCLLIESTSALAEFAEARPELERFASTAQFAATHWMVALCVFGRFAEAWWASELVRPIIFDRLSMTSHVADHMLFRGIAAAALAREQRGMRRWSLCRAALQAQRYLRRWARHGPDFAPMASFVQAERLWTQGRALRALALYERVASDAHERGYVHYAALAHERRAELLEAQGRAAECDAALAQALALYRAWGAAAKVRALESR